MIALVVILVLFVPAISASLGSSAQSDAGTVAENVTGESLTVDYDDPTGVAESGDAYSETITIRDENGTELEDGIDYRWNDRTGVVDWIDTTETSDGENATIDYRALNAPERSEESNQFIVPFTTALPWLLLFVGGLVALKLADQGWS